MIIRSRCHNLSDLMSEGQGKSNMDRYQDAVEQEKSLLDRLETLSPGAKATREKTLESLRKVRELLPALQKVKDEPSVGETAYKAARALYRQARYKRGRVNMQNKYVRKGLLVEEMSIEALSILTGQYYQKNERLLENEYLLGTPDIFLLDHIDTPIENALRIEDVKNTWDLDSFLEKTVMEKYETRYWWQLQGYMHLLPNVKEARIDYLLVNAPFDSVIREIKNTSYLWEGEENIPVEQKWAISCNLLYTEDAIASFWEHYDISFATSNLFQDYLKEKFVEIPAQERVFLMPVIQADEAAHRAIEERVRWANRYIKKTFSWPLEG